MSQGQTVGRYGHHPDPAIDFCIEVEELESIAANQHLGLTGFGHEKDYTSLDHRIERAMEFRAGADQQAIEAKTALRKLATKRGFILTGGIGYAGQPIPRSTPKAAGENR